MSTQFLSIRNNALLLPIPLFNAMSGGWYDMQEIREVSFWKTGKYVLTIALGVVCSLHRYLILYSSLHSFVLNIFIICWDLMLPHQRHNLEMIECGLWLKNRCSTHVGCVFVCYMLGDWVFSINYYQVWFFSYIYLFF